MERWDIKLVNTILPTLKPDHQDARILRDVRDRADPQGYVTIHYSYGKTLSFGRVFSAGRGYQSLSRDLRPKMYEAFYVEDDIGNALPKHNVSGV